MANTHLLPVPIIGQPTDYACGNTSLAVVMQYHRRARSPDEMKELAGTRNVGTDHSGMVKGALACGATVFVKSSDKLQPPDKRQPVLPAARKSIDELRFFISKGLPVIVGWWSMERGDRHHDPAWSLDDKMQYDCGHFSVVCGTTPKNLVIMDPQDNARGKTRGLFEISDDAFARIWYDTDTDDYVRVIRWYMVANFEGLRFAKRFGGADHAPKR